MLSNIGSSESYKYLFLLIPIYGSNIFLPKSILLTALLIAISGYLIFYIIAHRRNLDLYDLFLITFTLYVVAISAYWQNLSFGMLSSAILLAALPIYIKSKLQISNTLLKSLYMIYVMLVVVNFFTIIFPSVGLDGTKEYFIGGKNALAVSLIPAMFFISYYSYLIYKKITRLNFLLLVIIIASLYLSGSSTGAVVATGATIFVIFIRNIRIKPIIYVTTYIGTQLLLLSSNRLNSVPVLADYVEKYFGKDLTFSGRTDVWEIATQFIPKSFFGYGKGNDIIANNYSSDYGQILTETHNTSLELLLVGGVILLVIFTVIVFGTFSLNKLNNKNILVRISYFYTFLYFILGLTESVAFKPELWIMFAVIASTNSIIRNNDESNVRNL